MAEMKIDIPRIAIPVPHSSDREYAEGVLPQYEKAVRGAGGEPVRIELDLTPMEVTEQLKHCDAVLLPGSGADVDPQKYGAKRHEKTEPADRQRARVDELLLQDAYNMRKPVLGICYGLQSLNVYRSGSLIQHVPDFLPEDLRTRVNHEAGKNVAVAHAVKIESESKLAEILCGESRPRLSSGAQLDGTTDSGAPLTFSPEENREGHGFSRADKGSRSNGALAPEGNKLIFP